MGEFGLWCVGIVVACAALSPSDTGKWAARFKAAFDAEAAKLKAGK